MQKQTPSIMKKKRCCIISSRFSTISSQFFAIFHKTEVLTVILRCLMGLNLDWVKSYGLKCSLRHRASSASTQKIATDKQPFFANYMFIFHKTEIQTVILRCLMSLDLNWYKSYYKKHKNAKNANDENLRFCTKSQKKRNGNICVFCHNF